MKMPRKAKSRRQKGTGATPRGSYVQESNFWVPSKSKRTGTNEVKPAKPKEEGL